MKHNYKLYCKDYENIENYEKAKADNFIGITMEKQILEQKTALQALHLED